MYKHYQWIVTVVLTSVGVPLALCQENTETVISSAQTISVTVDEDGKATIHQADGDSDAIIHAHVYATESDVDIDVDDATGNIMIKTVVFPDDPENVDGGWLGVHLSELSPALKAHTGLEEGVMIVDVIEGSPADQAGLEQWDILSTIDSETVGSDIPGAAEIIGATNPGSIVTLSVIRNGSPIQVQATLGERPAVRNVALKHGFTSPAMIEDMVSARARVLSQDKDGNWSMKDLGELSEFKHLPDTLKALLEGQEEKRTVVDQQAVTIAIKSGEDMLTITKDNDSQITVERISEDGSSERIVYPDVPALEEADPEAAKYYTDSISGSIASPGANGSMSHLMMKEFRHPGGMNIIYGTPGSVQLPPHLNLDVVIDGLDTKLKDTDIWVHEMEQAFGELERSKDMIEKNRSMIKVLKMDLDDKIEDMLKDLPTDSTSHISIIRTPDVVENLNVVFEPSGKTVVTYRCHHASIVETYNSEQDFRDGNPALYKLYLDSLAEEDSNR